MSTTYQEDSHSRLIWLPIILLIIFIGCMVVAFQFASSENNKTQRYLAILSEQSLLSQQIAASTSQSVLLDGAKAFSYIKELRDKFDANLKTLKTIDSDLLEDYKAETDLLDKEWKTFREKVDMILLGQKIIADSKDHATAINQLIPDIQRQAEEITEKLTGEDLPINQLMLVSRQTMLIQRIDNNVNRVLGGNRNVETAADQFAADAEEFGNVVKMLIKGDASKDVVAIKQREAIRALTSMSKSFRHVSEKISTILDVAPALNKLSNASFSIETQSRILLRAILNIQKKFQDRKDKSAFYNIAAFLFGALAFLTALLLGYMLFKQARQRLEDSREENESQQAAILQLLEEMNTLAEGDLTIRATVTESITGAIADSVNYAVEALRILVTKINNTSSELTGYAKKANKNIKILSAASRQQTQEINESSESISSLIKSIKDVSNNASSSAQVAQKSLEISHAGAAKVRNTIAGMSTVREQIQSTSKRIKRLSESSQEISNIVHLMNDIAEQTNVLALNAAIQASAAKNQSHSQNFSALSDEVQQLSQDAAEATRKIEVLVRAILADTEEAVASMEVTTANVVEGTRNAETAKNALDEIESVSTKLADLIENISTTSANQSSAAEQINDAIGAIKHITRKTSDQVIETTSYIGDVTRTTAELRESIYGFVLPNGANSNDKAPMK